MASKTKTAEGDAWYWKWEIDLKLAEGSNVRLETNEGVYREGRLSKVTTKKLPFLGRDVLLPEALELNSDPNDRIPFSTIRSVILL
jgi:hypothetical protein